MRITCHYVGICLVSRGTYIPPTTPSLLFWFVVLAREFLQRKGQSYYVLHNIIVEMVVEPAPSLFI